jgi:hypothetical protein
MPVWPASLSAGLWHAEQSRVSRRRGSDGGFAVEACLLVDRQRQDRASGSLRQLRSKQL